MDTQDYNKAENAVDKAKWTINDYADRAKDYIREQREKNDQHANVAACALHEHRAHEVVNRTDKRNAPADHEQRVAPMSGEKQIHRRRNPNQRRADHRNQRGERDHRSPKERGQMRDVKGDAAGKPLQQRGDERAEQDRFGDGADFFDNFVFHTDTA